jgi:nanoRNase/pAp phosphatase (c-di-AMP/oligoRNAs hydrolase)
MQVQAEDFALLANLIKQAKNILILVREDPSVDILAAGLFLENTFSGLGKHIQIVARGKIPEEFGEFHEKITNKIEATKLVISFNWQKNAVEKVSYSLEGEAFNFIISPRGKKISETEIKISSKGDEADLVITLGVPSLLDLEEAERGFLGSKTVVNVDNNSENQLFGKLNFVDRGADSISGIVANLAKKSQLQAKPEAADFLLFGLRVATDNFNRVDDPATFEGAAFCAKLKKQQPCEQPPERIGKPQVPKEWLAPKIFRSNRQAS